MHNTPGHERATIAVVAMALLASQSCGGSLRPEDIPDISGSWTYSEQVTSYSAASSCETVGTLNFEQSFETFVGSFSRSVLCSGVAKPPEGSIESGPISEGRVDERTIEFRMSGCDYRGALTEKVPDRISGSTLCLRPDIAAASAPEADAGSWTAERLSDPTN